MSEPPTLSERVQRQVELLLDQAEEAIGRSDWDAVREKAEAVLRVDAGNHDAASYLAMASVGRAGPEAGTRPTGTGESD